MKVLKAIDKIIAKITEALLILSVAFMTVVLSGNVFARFALHKSITSAEEIGKYCVVIMTFVALAYIAQQDKHVKISLFFDILSWKGKKIMSIVVCFISAVIIGFISLKAYDYLLFTITAGRTSAVLGIPVSYVAAAIFIGFTLLCIEYVIELIMNIVSKDNVYIGRLPLPRNKGKELITDDN